MNLPVSKISEHEETYSTSLFSMLLPLGSDSIAKQDEIYNVQKEVIREMAEKESCIIVGRCADYIFRDHRNVLNIYIYAPVDARYKNCVEVLKMKPEEATKMIYKVDKAHTREYGGNGIGLSIVKAIMESFHQKYGVRNFDNGVEFWFELDGKSALHEEQNAIK